MVNKTSGRFSPLGQVPQLPAFGSQVESELRQLIQRESTARGQLPVGNRELRFQGKARKVAGNSQASWGRPKHLKLPMMG